MSICIREEAANSLEAYASVPIALTVRRRLRIEGAPSSADDLVEEVVEEVEDPPWVKDYDADAGPPSRLAERWDLSNWGALAAFDDERRVGGALIAWRTDGVDMLERRDDRAVLWDLRVHPDVRRRGVGSTLLHAVLAWTRQRGCTRVDVETQDINVPACRFYAHHGFRLLRVEPDAYPDLPGEAKLLWTRTVSAECDHPPFLDGDAPPRVAGPPTPPRSEDATET